MEQSLAERYNQAPKLIGTDAFEYSALPNGAEGENWIRTLRLQAGSEDETIEIILQNTCLKATGPARKYEALSYVWGSTKETAIIRCNGLKLCITKSLHTTLVALRDQHTIRTLWADAVCINQQDTAERAAQVSIMARIFDQASQVVVWLGPSFESSRLAFDLCRKCAKSWKRRPSEDIVGADFQNSVQAVRRKHQLPTRVEPYTALLKLLHLPWFKRVWVIQEVIAARSATLKCGHDEIDWDDFAGGVRWAAEVKIMPFAPPVVIGHLYRLLEIRQRANQNTFDFSSLLCHFSPCEATDPRDKIFAFYGMQILPKMEALKRELDEIGISPDYTISHDILYIQCFKKIISVSGSLDILYRIGLDQLPSSTLPSWVPDIIRPKFPDPLSRNMSLLCASKSSRPSCRLESKTLIIKGTIADTISELGETCPHLPTHTPLFTAPYLKSLLHIARLARTYLSTRHAHADWDRLALRRSPSGTPINNNPTAEPPEESYWQTLQCHNARDTGRDTADGSPRDVAVMRRAYAAFYRGRFISRVGYAVARLGGGLFGGIGGGSGDGGGLFVKQMFLYSVYKHWEWSGSVFRSLLLLVLWPQLGWFVFSLFAGLEWLLGVVMGAVVAGGGAGAGDEMDGLFRARMCGAGKRLVRTSKGYLAMAPAESREGDSIAIFAGGRAPFAMREADGGGWWLIEACYVHGMMKGEVVDEDKCEELRMV